MADLGNLHFQVHLVDFTDAEADKIKKKLENLQVKLNIDASSTKVSNTDAIKKQIEAAVSSISIGTVKVDASAVKQQIETAAQTANPAIKVTLIHGSLSNDIQNYLNARTFNIGISITKGSAQNAANTAFANVSVPVSVSISSSVAIQQLKQSLANTKVKVDVEAKNPADFAKDIETKLANKKIKVNLEADQNTLVQSVKQALQGKVIKAHVDVSVDAQAITKAVQSAINNGKFTYSPSGKGASAGSAANAQRNLGNAYHYAARGAYESARASVVLGRSFHTNIRLAGELGTALGNFASVFGIKDLLQNMVQIGGQLENQRIALGAILQDGGKATEMFSKIQSLAVKSPFGIMDLNQYTKQLSAYSIPYNELYETMKRLADISAGVGVDMGRIVLAFGQVRAAGFLKGTELRQFTEANIPMVDKLAERFSNLEKRIVSAGEVYDMISEKKVTFEDVKSVLWDLTGEGGMFNNMQEVLSESLASKWKNLSDAVDVMYGKIADGMIGSGMKRLAEGLTELTKNWEYLATAIGSAASAYAAYKLSIAIGSGKGAYGVYNMIAANHKLEVSNLRVAQSYRPLSAAEQGILATKNRLTTAELRQAAASGVLTKEMALRLVAMKKISVAQAGHLKQVLDITRAEIAAASASSRWAITSAVLKNALYGIGAALKSVFLSPWTWVFAGFTAITEALTFYKKKQDEIEQRNKEFIDSTKGAAETLERELDKLQDVDFSKLNTDEAKIKVKELTTVIQNEADGWQSILSEIFAKEADGTFFHSAEEQLKLLKAKMDELAEAKKKLVGNDDSYSDVIGATETGFLWWEKDIVDKIEAYNEAVDKNDKKLKELAVHARDVSTALNMAVSGNDALAKSLEGKNLNTQVELLKGSEGEWKKFLVELTKINQDAAQIVNSWVNNHIVRGRNSEMLWDFGLARDKMISELTLQGEEVGKLTESGRQYVLGFVDGLIKEAAVQKPKVQQYIYDWFTGQFGLPKNDLGYTIPSTISNIGGGGSTGGSEKDTVAEMWKKRAAEIEKAVKMYDKWKKIEGTLASQNRVKQNEELASLFNGAYGFNLDLENPTKAYEYIQSKLDESKEKQKELKIQLGVKISDAEFNDAKKELDSFLANTKKYTEATIEKWQLYKKLFEATGDKKVSMNIAFGGQVSFKNQLEEMESKIRGVMDNLGIGISFDELIKMDTQSLKDAGWAGIANLIESYNKESRKFKEESISNFIDIIKASKDFEQQIADIDFKLQKDLKDLRDNADVGKIGGMSQEEYNRREAELIRKAEEDKSKVRFEEFKKSSDWVKVFDDLDRVSNATLDNMISKVEEFAKQANLGEEVTKHLVEAMRKLREESIERNPFRGMADAIKKYREAQKLRGSVGEYDEHGKLITQKYVNDSLAEAESDFVRSINEVNSLFSDMRSVLDPVVEMLDYMGIEAKAFRNLVDVVGEMISTASSFSSSISNIMGLKVGKGDSAKSLGETLGLENAGLWGAIAGAAIGMFNAAMKGQSKAIERQIEASEAREKAIENLSKNLEISLERTLGGIYSVNIGEDLRKDLQGLVDSVYYNDVLGHKIATDVTFYNERTIEKANEALREDSYYDAQLAALMAQRDEINEQLRLERKDKDSDEEKIEGYEQELKELEDQISNFAEDMANALYGIDFKSWSEQLAESLVDAWASGEDAVKAYKDTVSDILKDLGVSMISQQILEPLLEETMNQFLAQFGKDNGKLTDDSLEILAGMYKEAEYAASATEAYLEGLKKLGIDLSEKDEDASGGLSKGIQAVTEDTANLLASYLNAIRSDVSVKRSLVEKLIGEDVPKMNYLAEAQLAQLNQITQNTKRNADTADRIFELVNKVVDKGSNKLRV